MNHQVKSSGVSSADYLKLPSNPFFNLFRQFGELCHLPESGLNKGKTGQICANAIKLNIIQWFHGPSHLKKFLIVRESLSDIAKVSH